MKRLADMVFALVATSATAALAAPSCLLEKAEYSANGWTLTFHADKPPGFTLAMGAISLDGVLVATNNHGALEYEVGAGTKLENIAAGMVYGAVGTANGEVSESGVWYNLVAPPTIVLSNLDRSIFYMLKENGSPTDESPQSDFFHLTRCQ